MKDVTGEYVRMIEAFECDFVLARDDGEQLCLQEELEKGSERLLHDIELLEKLSYGLRYGKLRILELGKI